jgi:thimet oligopeptidase
MDYTQVTTFLHEFGHLMHHIIGGQQRWAGISGINLLGLEMDFVEAPSQMLERWAESPQVLAKFAHHYQTHAPIPAELVARMNRAAAFGRASWVARQNVYTALSYDLYSQDPSKIDIDAVADADQRRYAKFEPLSGTHGWASFGHLGGYSSAYYTYLWDNVIAQDLFAQFDQNNLSAGRVPQRYRSLVIQPGSSKSANDLIKEFLGRPQNTDAFQQWIRQEFAESP